MKIFFMTGRTCVGKTDFVNRLPDSSHIEKIRTGAIAKEFLSYDEMSTEEHPTTPSVAESKIREAILDLVDRVTSGQLDNSTVYVDSFPRSISQLEWLKPIIFKNERIFKGARVMYCWCKSDVLSGRVKRRLSVEPQKAKLTQARLQAESVNFVQFTEELFASGVPVELTDLTSISTNSGPLSISFNSRRNLDMMFTAHKALNDLVLSKLPHDKISDASRVLLENGQSSSFHPYTQNGVWLRRFLRAMMDEVIEAQAEVPEEWWTKDQIDVSKVRGELIDVLHFLISAAFCVGMDADEFAEAYYNKLAINIKRQHSDYKKHG